MGVKTVNIHSRLLSMQTDSNALLAQTCLRTSLAVVSVPPDRKCSLPEDGYCTSIGDCTEYSMCVFSPINKRPYVAPTDSIIRYMDVMSCRKTWSTKLWQNTQKCCIPFDYLPPDHVAHLTDYQWQVIPRFFRS